jgi:hypothetical protein
MTTCSNGNFFIAASTKRISYAAIDLEALSDEPGSDNFRTHALGASQHDEVEIRNSLLEFMEPVLKCRLGYGGQVNISQGRRALKSLANSLKRSVR